MKSKSHMDNYYKKKKDNYYNTPIYKVRMYLFILLKQQSIVESISNHLLSQT